MSDDDLTARVTELETLVAFQEDHIAQLNEALVEHGQALTELQRELKHLKDKLAALQPSPLGEGEEGPPPHY